MGEDAKLMRRTKLVRWLLRTALFALFLIPGLLATPLDETEYLTVIASDEGAELVVDAANFAAGMQVDGYTFTGTTTNTLTSIKDVEKKFLVFFKKGRRAIIADGLDNNHAVMRAKALLEEQGYSVELSVPSEVLPTGTEEVDETGEAEREETPIPEELVVAPENETCEGCEYGEQCLAVGTRTTNEYCSVTHEMKPLKAKNETCVYSYECWSNDCRGTCYEEPEMPEKETPENETPRPSIITRLFRWLAGLFS